MTVVVDNLAKETNTESIVTLQDEQCSPLRKYRADTIRPYIPNS